MTQTFLQLVIAELLRDQTPRTYTLTDAPESYVAAKPGKPAKESRITLAEISKMFDQLLWAARQGRGQA